MANMLEAGAKLPGEKAAEGRPTLEMYDELVVAYDHFNKALFGGELPPCLITLQRSKKSYGYFRGDRFASKAGEIADEIALNPAHFRTRAVEAVLSTPRDGAPLAAPFRYARPRPLS